jgi:UDP-2-acetamido-2-deoxy-ribo-hexuluronate aminotransferase
MIQVVDLAAQQNRLRLKSDYGTASVMAHGQYIPGPQLTEIE